MNSFHEKTCLSNTVPDGMEYEILHDMKYEILIWNSKYGIHYMEYEILHEILHDFLCFAAL